MNVELEASIQAEVQAKAKLGRGIGFSATVIEGAARLNLPGRPKPLIIDETKFTVESR
jgi:hypothetical protein